MTVSEIVVIVPDERVLFAGDLVWGGLHPNLGGGETFRWIEPGRHVVHLLHESHVKKGKKVKGDQQDEGEDAAEDPDPNVRLQAAALMGELGYQAFAADDRPPALQRRPSVSQSTGPRQYLCAGAGTSPGNSTGPTTSSFARPDVRRWSNSGTGTYCWAHGNRNRHTSSNRGKT